MQDWRAIRLPPLPKLPAMSSADEWRLYYWLTAERFQGKGAVVEVGSWLGAGTIHLAAGLRDRGSTAKVIAIDRFVWMGEIYDRVSAAGLAPGESFEHLFRANIAPLADHIEIVTSELKGFVWRGGPIEILAVDAPKQPDDAAGFIKTFGPSLIPGVSLVAFQDYLHASAYGLPVMLHEFRDQLALVDVVQNGSTALFEVRGPIVADERRLARCRLEGWTAEDAFEAWRGMGEVLPPAVMQRMALNLPLLLHRIGATDQAVEQMRLLKGDPRIEHQMSRLAPTSHYWRYRPLFDAIGVAPEAISGEMYLKLSIMEAQAGRIQPALQAARQAVAASPDDPRCQVQLGKMHRVATKPHEQPGGRRRLKTRVKRALRRFRDAGLALVRPKPAPAAPLPVPVQPPAPEPLPPPVVAAAASNPPAKAAAKWVPRKSEWWPDGIAPIPHMTTLAERRFYYRLTNELYVGEGAIVELGPWLGAGTAHLAAGLRDRGLATRLVTIDRFEWLSVIYDAKNDRPLDDGDDFEPLFREHTAPVADWIETVRADLEHYMWPGGPIEILVADAPKTVAEVVQLLRSFGPALIPGSALITFQDYLHNPSYALPFILGELSELAFEAVVLPGTTVAFRLERPLDLAPERLAGLDLADWSVEHVHASWQRLQAMLPAEAHPSLALSLPMFLHQIGATDAAARETEAIRELPIVRHRLGKWANSSLYWRFRPVFEAAGVRPQSITATQLVQHALRERIAGRPESAASACAEALALEPGNRAALDQLARLGRLPEKAAS